jgi:hypothetical protein
MLDVGGRYERYDYLRSGMFSPAITASVPLAARFLGAAHRGTRDSARPAPRSSCCRPTGRCPCRRSGPSRRWSPVSCSKAGDAPHRCTSLEQDIATFRVAVTHFRQNVDGQLATVFDLNLAKGRRRADLSHYGVASVDDFAARAG